MRSDSIHSRRNNLEKWAASARGKATCEIRRQVLEEAIRLQADLLDPAGNPGDFDDGKQKIAHALAAGLDPDKEQDELNRRMKAFAEFIEYGNHRGWWRITVPPYSIEIELDEPCLTPRSFVELHWVDDLRRNLHKTVIQSLPAGAGSEPAVLARLALLSGAVHAGLCTREKLLAFFYADLASLECDGAHAWLRADMQERWFSSHRRTSTGQAIATGAHFSFQAFLDAGTVLLVRRLEELKVRRLADALGPVRGDSAPGLWEHLASAIDATGTKMDSVRNLSALFSACTSWTAINNCGLLAHTAASNMVSPSLTPRAGARMCAASRSEPADHGGSDRSSRARLAAFRENQFLRLQPEHAIVQELKNLFSNHQKQARAKPAALVEGMEALRARLAPVHGSIQDLLLAYLQNRLELPRTQRAPKAISLRRYLDAMGHALIDSFKSINVLDLPAESRVAHYRDLLEDTGTPRERRYLGKRLIEFDVFIASQYDLEPIKHWQLGYSSQMILHGEGNLITPGEYDAVLTLLSPSPLHLQWREFMIAVLACILAFRCGLRIGEVRRLRVCDIRLHAMPMLEVLSNEHGETKSMFAERRIPLFAYLNPAEFSLLNDWLARRIREVGERSTQPFLVLSPDNPEPVNDDLIRIPVQAAMRAVTGDPDLTFRHLRHSFATWTLFKLTRDLNADMADCGIEALQHPEFSSQSCRRLRHILSPDTFDPSSGHHPVRNAVYYAASQLGHLSPETSLANYVHLLDLMLVTSLNASLRYSVEDIMAATGLKKSQVYERCRVKSGMTNGLELMHLLPTRRPAPPEAVATGAQPAPGAVPDVKPPVAVVSQGIGVDRVLKLVFELGEIRQTPDRLTDSDLDRCAAASQVSLQELASCYAVCQKLSRHYQTKRGDKRKPRHETLPWIPGPGAERQELIQYLQILFGPGNIADASHSRWAVDYFLSRTTSRVEHRHKDGKEIPVHRSRGLVWTRNADDAARYIAFLRMLGLDHEQFRVFWMPSADYPKSRDPRSECEQNLGLPAGTIREMPNREKRHENHGLLLAVSVENSGFLTGRSRRYHGPIRQKRSASRAFRSAMQIAAIAWTMQGEQPSQWGGGITDPHQPESPPDGS